MGWLIDLPLSYTDAVVVLGTAILGLAAGVLGALAVFRQRSLVGDALAHSALPGVCVAFIVTGAKDASTLLIGAGLAGIVGARMIVGIERTSRILPDAAIGVVLSTFFSLGIVLLTYIASTNDANQAGSTRSSLSSRASSSGPSPSARRAATSPTASLRQSDAPARGGWRGRVLGRVARPLAGEVLLGEERVVAGAADDAKQVGHRGHLLDLLLEKPLQELLALKVAFLSGKNSERPDLPADLALLLECEVYRGDDVVEAGARGRRPRDDGFGTGVE